MGRLWKGWIWGVCTSPSERRRANQFWGKSLGAQTSSTSCSFPVSCPGLWTMTDPKQRGDRILSHWPCLGNRTTPKKRGRWAVNSCLEREETAVSACHPGELPGRAGLSWGLEYLHAFVQHLFIRPLLCLRTWATEMSDLGSHPSRCSQWGN